MQKKIFTVLFFLLTLNSLAFSQVNDTTPRPSIQADNKEEKSCFVIFNNDTLFAISSYLGPYSPSERASAISGRLSQLIEMPGTSPDSFRIETKNHIAIIAYKNFPVLSITEKDAAPTLLHQKELAEKYLGIIKLKFKTAKKQQSVLYWVLRIAYTLATFAGLILLFYLINKLFKWINTRLVKYEKGLKEKRKSAFKYLAPSGPDYFFVFLSKIFKTLLIVIILFFYLPLLFSFLPWTKGWVNDFYVFVSIPLKKVLHGLWIFISQNLIYIVIIYIIARYILRILSHISNEIEAGRLKIKGFHRDWVRPTFNIIKVIVYAFTLVFIFPYIPGSGSKAFQGVSIFLGILLSLGSTSAIANIVAGVVITYMRPFRVGDRVKINETIGDIVEKNLLVTRIKTIKNEDVTIPNSTIINTHLWNYTKNAERLGIILHTSITIGYDVPSKTVINLLLSAAKITKGLSTKKESFVLQKSLNDFYVEYELNAYTRHPEKMALLYSELNRNILEEFNKAGIEILSPHYSAFRDGNESTITNEKNETGTKNPVNKFIDKIT